MNLIWLQRKWGRKKKGRMWLGTMDVGHIMQLFMRASTTQLSVKKTTVDFLDRWILIQLSRSLSLFSIYTALHLLTLILTPTLIPFTVSCRCPLPRPPLSPPSLYPNPPQRRCLLFGDPPHTSLSYLVCGGGYRRRLPPPTTLLCLAMSAAPLPSLPRPPSTPEGYQ